MTATHDQLKLYRSALAEAGYARGTINNQLSTVQRLYDAARDWGWRTDNPGAHLKARQHPTSRAERIASKYIPNRGAFLSLYTLPDRPTIVGLRDRAILRILCYGGLRVAELCALDLGDVFLEGEPQLVVRAGKGSKRRTIPLAESRGHDHQGLAGGARFAPGRVGSVGGAGQSGAGPALEHARRAQDCGRLSHAGRTQGSRPFLPPHTPLAGALAT
jgi:integrase